MLLFFFFNICRITLVYLLTCCYIGIRFVWTLVGGAKLEFHHVSCLVQQVTLVPSNSSYQPASHVELGDPQGDHQSD